MSRHTATILLIGIIYGASCLIACSLSDTGSNEASTSGGSSVAAGGSSHSGGTSSGNSTTAGRTFAGGDTSLGGTSAASSSKSCGGTTAAGGSISTGGTSAASSSKSSGGTTTSGGSISTGGQSSATNCTIPALAQPASVASPTTVVGTGTPASCTSAAFVAAVAKGGIITFNCGPNPVTIAMTATANIYNQVSGVNNEKVVIDGGGLITLDGGNARRILYQNTCDSNLIWATSTCDTQTFPKLTVQNIAFANGLGASSQVATGGLLGGGAIYVSGGTFSAYSIKVTGSKESHPAAELAQDLAGGALYLFELSSPAYIVNSTFQGNSATNGGAIGALFVSSVIINSSFLGNSATGHGQNPAATGTTGGGIGGAIYNDGNSYSLNICGSTFANNTATELGSGAIFEVVNNLKGDLVIDQSTFSGNSNVGQV